MANRNYDQLQDLVLQQKLNWQGDNIRALLVEGAVFNATDKTLADLGVSVTPSRNVPIQGRFLDGRDAYGQPALYDQVPEDTTFQVVLVKDDGSGNPLLLAFIDVNEQGEDLTMENSGTLIIRPSKAGTDPTKPPLTGVWLVF